MNERQLLLLQSITTLLELNPGDDSLLADQVNGLGSTLGLAPNETLNLVETLKQAGLVDLRWPGKVSVTSKGRTVLSQVKPSGDHITLGPGAVYVGTNAHIGAGAAVGSNAMAAGAVRVEQRKQFDLTALIAGLAAAHQQLFREHATLPPAAQQATEQLAEEAKRIQEEVCKPTIDKPSIEQRLDKAKGFLEKLGGVTSAAASLKPALELLHRSFDWLTTFLRGIAS